MSRSNVLLRKVCRHRWGADPNRVVVVAVMVEHTPEGPKQWARIIGAEGGRAAELERFDVETIERRPMALVLPDGTRRELANVGCSCNVPGPLRGLDVKRVP